MLHEEEARARRVALLQQRARPRGEGGLRAGRGGGGRPGGRGVAGSGGGGEPYTCRSQNRGQGLLSGCCPRRWEARPGTGFPAGVYLPVKKGIAPRYVFSDFVIVGDLTKKEVHFRLSTALLALTHS